MHDQEREDVLQTHSIVKVFRFLPVNSTCNQESVCSGIIYLGLSMDTIIDITSQYKLTFLGCGWDFSLKLLFFFSNLIIHQH